VARPAAVLEGGRPFSSWQNASAGLRVVLVLSGIWVAGVVVASVFRIVFGVVGRKRGTSSKAFPTRRLYG
jgi:hypothetical protein